MNQDFHFNFGQQIQKKIRFMLLAFSSILFLLSGCTQGISNSSDTVRVKIPWYTDGAYNLKTIELESVTDLKKLKGWAAKFYLSPGMVDGNLAGYEPNIHGFYNRENVFVPTDSLSTELLTLYAHFEFLKKFDQKIGTSNYISNWPRISAVGLRVQSVGENGQVQSDNARYSGELDAFLFESYTLSDLPFSLNAGVIGHEYFHSIFYNLFYKKLKPSLQKTSLINIIESSASQKSEVKVNEENKMQKFKRESRIDDDNYIELYHQFYLRGLNEGLADVWGWIYSNDTDFVQKSINPQSNKYPWIKERSLKINEKEGHLNEDLIRTLIFDSGIVQLKDINNSSSVYQLGSQYSRIIYNAVARTAQDKKMSIQDLKEKLAKGILKSLISLSQNLNQTKTKTLYQPENFIIQLGKEVPEIKIYMEENI